MVQWDAANSDHVARHGVTTDEVEEALADARRVGFAARSGFGERRYAVIGSTNSGRLLYVVYVRRERDIRPVTARNAAPSEGRRYRRTN